MATAIVTSKGQITIPKRVRDGLGVETGDRVEFVEEEKGVYKVVASTKDVSHLKGIIANPSRPVTVEEMNRVVRRRGGRR